MVLVSVFVSMRPGAAVRVKGTWYNTVDRKTDATDAADEPSVSSHSASHRQATLDHSEMSQNARGPRTVQELQVKAVDILGNSDPQVSRLGSIQGHRVSH